MFIIFGYINMNKSLDSNELLNDALEELRGGVNLNMKKMTQVLEIRLILPFVMLLPATKKAKIKSS